MKVGQQAYTELSIQIATLNMKLDKLLELAGKNDQLLDTEYVVEFDWDEEHK